MATRDFLCFDLWMEHFDMIVVDLSIVSSELGRKSHSSTLIMEEDAGDSLVWVETWYEAIAQ